MRKILGIAIFLIICTAIYSLNRFGMSFTGFLKGDGAAVLQAATTLLGIWALVIGFGIRHYDTFPFAKASGNTQCDRFHHCAVRPE